MSQRQDDWVEHLPMAEFAINARTHSAHRYVPFEVAYGYLPHFNWGKVPLLHMASYEAPL